PKVAEPRRPAEFKALAMPSPEQLGVGAAKADSNVDWNLLHRRFRDAGATCFQIDQRPTGGCKLTCLLPTSQSDRTRHIEVEAGSESEVARLALEQLQEWTRKK